jgi:Rrf2 family protein
MSVHALCMLAEGDTTHTSQDIAASLKTNAVVIRRMLATLQSAGIIASSKGPNGGSRLARPPKQISLGEVFRATESGSRFHLHETAALEHRGVVGALGGVLKKAQAAFEDELNQTSLNQLLKKAAKRSGKK